MRWTPFLLAAVLLASLSACGTTTTRTHPDIAEQLKSIKRVVVAPPEIEVTLITFTGENERIEEVESQIRTELLTIARKELEEGGYQVVDFDFEAAKQEDDTLAYSITEFVSGYDNAKEELQHGKAISLDEANSIRASLGEAATRVAAAADADAVLLIRFGGFQKSGGQVAKDVGTSILVGVLTLGAVIPIQPASGAFTEVALVDGYTGDVLWTDIRGGALGSELTDSLMDQLPDDIDGIDDVGVVEPVLVSGAVTPDAGIGLAQPASGDK